MITASRVLDTRKPITSRSGLSRAVKALQTLATAQETLRTSGASAPTIAAIGAYIDELSLQVATYYRNANAGMRAAR